MNSRTSISLLGQKVIGRLKYEGSNPRRIAFAAQVSSLILSVLGQITYNVKIAEAKVAKQIAISEHK